MESLLVFLRHGDSSKAEHKVHPFYFDVSSLLRLVIWVMVFLALACLLFLAGISQSLFMESLLIRFQKWFGPTNELLQMLLDNFFCDPTPYCIFLISACSEFFRTYSKLSLIWHQDKLHSVLLVRTVISWMGSEPKQSLHWVERPCQMLCSTVQYPLWLKRRVIFIFNHFTSGET